MDGDVSPEGLEAFRVNGKNYLAIANEVSGTTSVVQFDVNHSKPRAKTQIPAPTLNHGSAMIRTTLVCLGGSFLLPLTGTCLARHVNPFLTIPHVVHRGIHAPRFTALFFSLTAAMAPLQPSMPGRLHPDHRVRSSSFCSLPPAARAFSRGPSPYRSWPRLPGP